MATTNGMLERVRDAAIAAGVFGPVTLSGQRLTCAAKASAEPAEYRLDIIDGKLWVSLVTANRWLSESIETDLLHTGDKLDELLEDELHELDVTPAPGPLAFQHYRSDDKLFTFRSIVPVDPRSIAPGTSLDGAVDTTRLYLLAYEACFRRLGDMEASEEGED